jgi:hypothetical protein
MTSSELSPSSSTNRTTRLTVPADDAEGGVNGVVGVADSTGADKGGLTRWSDMVAEGAVCAL